MMTCIRELLFLLGLQAALMGRQDAELLAVLGYGPPRDVQPLPVERLSDQEIAQALHGQGLTGSSPATMSRIVFFTATEETMDPLSDAMPLWKKNLSSNRPCGVWTYLLVVTQLMVDSCMLMSSPTSRRASGRR